MLWLLWPQCWARLAAGLSLGAERTESQAQAVDLTRGCGLMGSGWPKRWATSVGAEGQVSGGIGGMDAPGPF